MTKKVEIDVRKENHNQIMGIICRYAKGRVDILSKEDHNEIRFECSIFWVKRLKRDIGDLADKLGLELKIEIE